VQLADSATTEWVRRYHTAPGNTTRLVCFPHAGGSASFFHPMSARHSPGVDVVALQYPGRQDRRREPCIATISALADVIAGELRSLSEKPTIFFGHSMGAVLAFEVARRLEHNGPGAPKAIIASGRRGPSTQRDEKVHLGSDDDVIADIKLLNGTDISLLNDELMQLALPAIRSDYRAIETYTCEAGRAVRCSITAMTGDADPKTTVDEARAWDSHTEGSFRVDVYTGGHFFIVEHQVAVNDEIARQLKALA
jgi:surfactin synthase thioesterase subunit